MKAPPFYEINSDVFVIGSVISTKKDELNNLLDHFNIQVFTNSDSTFLTSEQLANE